MEWTIQEQAFFRDKELSIKEIERQLALFRKGAMPTVVVAPCTPGNGVYVPHNIDLKTWTETFAEGKDRYSLLKFVPASGAATRMFAHLLSPNTAPDRYQQFFRNLPAFPFFATLKSFLEDKGLNLEDLSEAENWEAITPFLLDPTGLNYNALPKGAIPFHQVNGEVRTAFEEHVWEALDYAQSNGIARLHFTVPTDFSASDRQALLDRAHAIGKQVGIQLELNLSEQFASTDTLAMTLDGAIFRDERGLPLFRPGGHGALLHNLAAQEADMVFIKNIDNVLPSGRQAEMRYYKKALGGLLMQLHEERNRLYHALRSGESGALLQALMFIQRWFNPKVSEKLSLEEVIAVLDRPIRVCGMVENKGEPGGGPYWVRLRDGSVSVQIVEASQLQSDLPEQRAVIDASTHFNPVDLVCALKDPHGKAYDLHRFVNPERAFITRKHVLETEACVLELPGLWNGAMEEWLSVFVEVPLSTFAPVKTVNDLLRPEHNVS